MYLINEVNCKHLYAQGVAIDAVIKDAEEEIREIYAKEEERRHQEEMKKKQEREKLKEQNKLKKEREQLLDSSMDNLAKFFTSFVTDKNINKDELAKELKAAFIENMDGYDGLLSGIDKTVKKKMAAAGKSTKGKTTTADFPKDFASVAENMCAILDMFDGELPF